MSNATLKLATPTEDLMAYDYDAQIRNLFALTPSGYGTHRPVLAEAVLRTSGAILEIGAGFNSTAALRQAAMIMERSFDSFETNKEWAQNCGARYVWSYDHVPIETQPWGLAFVDHAPAERRVREIARLASFAAVVVVHDTEDPLYGYAPYFEQFYRFRNDYRELTPWTTVLSNFVDVSEWEIQ